MEHKKTSIKLVAVAALSALFLSNCVQSYDSTGRPIQTVDPGAAIVGAAVIGAIAYAAGDNRSHYRGSRGYRGGHSGYRGGSRYRY